MPRGRSTFTKRQKSKRASRNNGQERAQDQRKDEKPGGVVLDEAEELRQMREHAAEQAALFGIGLRTMNPVL